MSHDAMFFKEVSVSQAATFKNIMLRAHKTTTEKMQFSYTQSELLEPSQGTFILFRLHTEKKEKGRKEKEDKLQFKR